MLAISNEIRVPDFLFPLYPALLALPVPTPSRLLSVMDPLLGFYLFFFIHLFILICKTNICKYFNLFIY